MPLLRVVAIAIYFVYMKYFSEEQTKIEKYNECQWFIDGKIISRIYLIN